MSHTHVLGDVGPDSGGLQQGLVVAGLRPVAASDVDVDFVAARGSVGIVVADIVVGAVGAGSLGRRSTGFGRRRSDRRRLRGSGCG
jgi:hypothetical protein